MNFRKLKLERLSVSAYWPLLFVLTIGHFLSPDLISAEKIDFTRDIQPILSDKCYACHGPDIKQRQANLRLDQREGAFEQRGEQSVITPYEPLQSQLYLRVIAKDKKDLMPPVHSERSLSQQEIEMLKSWIEAGAEWKEHWSLDLIQKPIIPNDWEGHPIDFFIQKRLHSEGLTASEIADKRDLIRRVTFDLTGLPPTSSEIHRFLADKSPKSYENLVGRLLDKSQYGEHMARFWLDVARYGDTHGLHLDNFRQMWPYRDWVINAFNTNMPFDQFTIEQLAGDLLPTPTLQQKVATGFNRCNVTTSEGGSIDEEYYVRYAIDRASTTSTVWMGLTMGCATCHDHKFDPITQKEFYQFYSYFNNITERAMDGNVQAVPPVVKVATTDQKEELEKINQKLSKLRAKQREPMPEVDADQKNWESQLPRWTILQPVSYSAVSGAKLKLLNDNSVLVSGVNPDHEVYEISAKLPAGHYTSIRLQGLVDDSLPQKGAGRSENGNVVLSEFEAEFSTVDQPDKWEKIVFSQAWADHEQPNGDFKIVNAIDGKTETGWATEGFKLRESRQAIFLAREAFGKSVSITLRLLIKHQSPHTQHNFGKIRLAVTQSSKYAEMEKLPVPENWYTVGPFPTENFVEVHPPEESEIDINQKFLVGDKKLTWEKKKEYIDGEIHSIQIPDANAIFLYRNIHSFADQKVTFSLGSDDAIKVWANELEIFSKDVSRGVAADQDQVVVSLKEGQNKILLKIINYGGASGFYFNLPGKVELIPAQLFDLVSLPESDRSEAQRQELQNYYRQNISSHLPLKEISKAVKQQEMNKSTVEDSIATTLVMAERETPRGAYILHRGDYTQRREQVQPNTPAFLPPMDDKSPQNRMGLAKWLVHPDHPLTARVTINRFWQQVFGTGIVKTAEDFGSQGERPSHPQLLDWLATELIESGWDIKQMMRLLVSSDTYKQKTKVTPMKLEKDPENRFYARGPRFRLDAEMIRDQALAVSGLLYKKIGGPSVKPPQPDGLWNAVAYTDSNTARFVSDTGKEKVHRRSLYTFWKRTAPPPQMAVMDAPSREVCTVRRERTNTPLQALMLMNDPQFVEAARAFAERVIKEGGTTIQEKLVFAFELATARPPDTSELIILEENLQKHLHQFESDSEAGMQLIRIGESEADDSIEVVELAAWTMIANLILNLDEVLTKG